MGKATPKQQLTNAATEASAVDRRLRRERIQDLRRAIGELSARLEDVNTTELLDGMDRIRFAASVHVVAVFMTSLDRALEQPASTTT